MYTILMYYYEVAPNQIVRSDHDYFTYSSKSLLDIGQIVLIEVGKKQMVGIVMNTVNKPKFPTKEITSTLNSIPLPKQLVDLALWMSKYYASPLANVIQTILPRGIQKNRQKNKLANEFLKVTKRERTNIVFNKEQSSVLDIIKKSSPGTYLLQGVTGSGKTEVYIEIAKQAISRGRSAVVLVPEISLTSQIVSDFSNHFSDILITHSKMTEATRHNIWTESLTSTTPKIIIGPRSAIFSPLKNIGAIIIDEAHETSYKQEQAPKYSTLRIATMLGRFHKANVIFGSATPNIIDRYLAEQSNRPILKLTKQARQNITPANIALIDIKKRDNFKNHRFISDLLLDQIEKTLREKKQVLIFHNRRGSANTTLCKECGWTAECPRCSLPLTLHADQNRLFCHICGHSSPVPLYCPNCKSTDVIYKGIGTKLIESELRKLFPNANIARFDADNTAKDSANTRYDDIYNGKIDIIIGTQIIAKGLDLPNLRTVGIVQADTGLVLPDYNTKERTFQLLAQAVGRVGRNEHKTQVIVQTYQPTHPSIIYGINQDYESFYKYALKERSVNNFPPFSYLLKLTCTYKTEAGAIQNSKKLAITLRKNADKNVQILGPTPAFYERQYNTFRWQIVLKSPKREYLVDLLKYIPPKYWQFELDPVGLL